MEERRNSRRGPGNNPDRPMEATRRGFRPRRDYDREEKPRKPQKLVKRREKIRVDVKLFGRWESNSNVTDPGLKGYINVEPKFLPRSEGSQRGRFHKSRMHVVERLALKMLVSGHTGKKHKLTSGKFGGGFNTILKVVENALAIIEKKEQKNPIDVLVMGIENAALREEVISYQMGSIMARESVVTAPQRRVDKTLRFFAQAAYRKAFNKKKGLAAALADEIIAASKNTGDSFAVKEKERIEREASGAR
ncbi:MAG TPA: 30S ribosomal protein S7 [archaeon]|nr:30S ribosomal protein S7 [archaeon]